MGQIWNLCPHTLFCPTTGNNPLNEFIKRTVRKLWKLVNLCIFQLTFCLSELQCLEKTATWEICTQWQDLIPSSLPLAHSNQCSAALQKKWQETGDICWTGWVFYASVAWSYDTEWGLMFFIIVNRLQDFHGFWRWCFCDGRWMLDFDSMTYGTTGRFGCYQLNGVPSEVWCFDRAQKEVGSVQWWHNEDAGCGSGSILRSCKHKVSLNIMLMYHLYHIYSSKVLAVAMACKPLLISFPIDSAASIREHNHTIHNNCWCIRQLHLNIWHGKMCSGKIQSLLGMGMARVNPIILTTLSIGFMDTT